MTSLLAALLAAALSIGPAADPDTALSSLNYNVQFDEATGSSTLTCEASSTGRCTFWFGDDAHAAGSGTLAVGDAPAIVRVSAAHPAYCVGVDADAPPKWPDCTRGPLGGALDRSESVDYRRH